MASAVPVLWPILPAVVRRRSLPPSLRSALFMSLSRDSRFDDMAAALGYRFDGEIKIGGHYVPVVRHGSEMYVSGQIPRVGDTVVVTGRVGADIALPQAQLAARICAMRALALLRRSLGTLDKVSKVLRIS